MLNADNLETDIVTEHDDRDDSGISSAYFDDQLQSAYLDYSMTVIVSRAIPDAFDGCKPVQRRILYCMAEAGYFNSSPYKKCVAVVGQVLAKYHPHGQSAVYEALVRMAQPFSLNTPLIDGQGNFGSVDGDPPASDRYTECRLTKIARCLLEGYNEGTVPMVDNFDASLKMPLVLPAGFPNLLVNGAYGIAVGMSTSIPPHNLGEVIDATCALIDNPEISLEELLDHIQGPDLPTGGVLIVDNILNIYGEGRGSFLCRGIAEIEGLSIIITEIPYQLNKSRLVEEIIGLAKNEEVPEISAVRDESSLEGIRVVVELKRGTDAELILRKLFAKTSLESNINVHMLALQNQRPRQFGLVDLLQHFIDEREKIIINRTEFYLKNARLRAHILWGQALAISKLKEIINIITGEETDTMKARDSKENVSSPSTTTGNVSTGSAIITESAAPAYQDEVVLALERLEWPAEAVRGYLELIHESCDSEVIHLSRAQIKAILDLRLRSLTRLEKDKILNEIKELGKKIQEFQKILDNREERYTLIKVEMNNIKQKFATPRKASVTRVAQFDKESPFAFVREEEVVVTLTQGHIIKSTPLVDYKTQRRGGQGRSGEKVEHEDEADPVRHVIITNTHSEIVAITEKGKAYSLPVSRISQKKGTALINLIACKDQDISALLSISKMDAAEALAGQSKKRILFVTSDGYVRLNEVKDFIKMKSDGKRAMDLSESNGESLVAVLLAEESDQVLLTASNGKGVRFNLGDQVRVFKGREAKGVMGISLSEGAKVVSVTPIKAEEQDKTILTVTARGFGKLSNVSSYRLTGRGAKGVIVATIDDSTGPLLGAYQVSEGDQALLVSHEGQSIRCGLESVRVVSRTAKGVILMRFKNPGDRIKNVSIIKAEEE